jgi:putative pyruvate formate lyase activating enzyme
MSTTASRQPSYLRLQAGELQARADRAIASLAHCRACPRECDVDRLADKWSACKTGRHAIVSSAFPHLGEEDCLRGRNGSGTIFFGHCNLRCVFCQNFDISQGVPPGSRAQAMPARALADTMLHLQQVGCHNINLVTPEHVVPQVLEALALAVPDGLHLPIVYNTSAYDSLESLSWMNGIVDIYMPDFKCWTSAASRRYLRAADYPDAARAALREMHRQVGDLEIGIDGLAVRGVLVRHLVMPDCLGETRAILGWLARELAPRTYVNLMAQYRPAGHVSRTRFPEMNRPITGREYQRAFAIAKELGLRLDRRLPGW